MEEEPYYLQHHQTLPLLHAALSPSPSPTTAPNEHHDTLDFDVVVILAAMICALVCALGLNSMLQCVVRCTRRTLFEPAGWVASRRLNAGLKKEDVVALPVTTYTAPPSSGSPVAAVSRCAICLADFSDGEKIRVLPDCSHRFHVGCIDKWLLSRCSCPTCRHRLSSHGSDETHLENILIVP